MIGGSELWGLIRHPSLKAGAWGRQSDGPASVGIQLQSSCVVGRGLQTPTMILREGLKTLAYIGFVSPSTERGLWTTRPQTLRFAQGDSMHHVAYWRRRWRAITSFWISLVPSPISMKGASRE